MRSHRSSVAAAPSASPLLREAAALRRFVWPLLLAGCAGAQKPAQPAVSAAELAQFAGSSASEELGTQGWIVVQEIREAGDAVVVEGRLMQGPEPEELRVAIWRPTPEGWKLVGRGEPVAGSQVELLAPARCDSTSVLLFAAVEDEPDLRRHRMLVYEGMPELRKAFGVQRDVDAALAAGFEKSDGGFAFRAGEAVERWRCAGGAFEVEPPAP